MTIATLKLEIGAVYQLLEELDEKVDALASPSKGEYQSIYSDGYECPPENGVVRRLFEILEPSGSDGMALKEIVRKGAKAGYKRSTISNKLSVSERFERVPATNARWRVAR